MGTWGYKFFQNDIAMDLKDSIDDLNHRGMLSEERLIIEYNELLGCVNNYHIKGYISSSFDGKVRCYGIGISSSKFGFSPLSVTGYLMVPPQIILSLAGLFVSMVDRVRRIAQMA